MRIKVTIAVATGLVLVLIAGLSLGYEMAMSQNNTTISRQVTVYPVINAHSASNCSFVFYDATASLSSTTSYSVTTGHGYFKVVNSTVTISNSTSTVTHTGSTSRCFTIPPLGNITYTTFTTSANSSA